MILNGKPLIVLEVANNHQGDLDHGLKIIKEFSKVCKNFISQFDFAIKFQYRHLDTFVHPDYRDQDIKYVRRFLDTQLSENEWKSLLETSKNNEFKIMCTPFDEKSVNKVVKDGFDFLKIASASLDDWPLIEEVGNTDMKIIASVGGSNLETIKRFYTFMKNREKIFALNYCVSTYPTSIKNLNLEYISFMKKIFPDIEIGFSTHEGNEGIMTGALAYAQGARIFEKHIALPDKNKNYNVNEYSCLPNDLNIWLENLEQSTQIIGSIEGRSSYLNSEIEALRPLKRGAFSKENIKKEKVLNVDDFYFAIPSQEDQLLANDVSKFSEIVSKSDQEPMSDIKYSNLEIRDNKKSLEVIRDKVLELMSEVNLNYLSNETLEISHHYGIDSFYEYGSSLVTIINKLYCKKIITMLPGQENPTHFHKKKEESFIILHGELIVNLENEEHILNPGDILHIPLTYKHSFRTKNGSVFEEISTTHFTDDSYYSDQKIMDNKNRKSYIPLR